MTLVEIDLDPERRSSLSDALDLIAKDAAMMAIALRARRDTDALVNLVTMSLTMFALEELREVYTKAITVSLAKVPDDASTLSQKEN